MRRLFNRACAYVALASLSCLCLGATPAASLPGPLAGDVHESYRLLTSSYYRPLEAQTLLSAAAAALVAEAGKHGVTIATPSISAGTSNDETMAQLDGAIASAAAAANGPQTVYAYVAINAMAKAVGDRYTQFFTPDEFKQFNEALDPARISGIGVMIEPDLASGFTRISYVVPQTPADRAGLRSGDLIARIDSKATKGLLPDAVSKLLRGKPGTVVTVDVARAGSPQTAYSIQRQEVQPPTVIFRMLPDSIGYIFVAEFGKATPGEFDTAVARLKGQGARALVLDLRNDGGGYVDSALFISSRFIANQALLTVEERDTRPTTIKADNDTSVSVPVSVLVNQYTASASEITAGALQDDGVGPLIGTKTFGKGVMQTLTPLPDGAAIKITTAHYLTPHQRDINLKGIEPDVPVAQNSDFRFGEIDRDAQLRMAISLLQKKIATVKPL
jgi:carboxyl-terminal processing protease